MLTDHQNTVRDVVKYDSLADTTTVVNHIAYNAFGEMTSESNSSLDTLDLYYTARYTDDATGPKVQRNGVRHLREFG
ncbi:hypothetical protein [Blastopirellula retiformator]|uniref:RHS Repeat protein n=1 Tax=Blastopirellula retiformator TaxID=2527970 RepID=A0A5C5UW31_9BACT|nr:hypothetical protein [Blastopirellula retiformator]TWT29632.1 hypothetical protein Enr8_48200 [Blastopirellula retiformator]